MVNTTDIIPTELVATQVTNISTTIPNGMSINPILDWSPVGGIPLWVYITFGFVLALILVNVYWLLRIGKLSSVKGWSESLKAMTQEDVQVWVISRVQKLTIECMTVKDNILSSHDPMNIGMWHVNSPMGIIRVGGNSAVVISEDFDQNRDFVTEIALCYGCDDFNSNQERFKKEMDAKYLKDLEIANQTGLQIEEPKVIKPIDNCEAYESYGRKCLYTLNVDGLKIPSYNLFNPNKFRKYFPRGCSGMFFGGELIHDARKLNLRRKEKGFWEVNTFLIMASGISLIAIMAAWLFPLGGH